MPKAVCFSQFGLENLHQVSQPSKPLGAFDLRVSPKAVSLNYRDFLMIQGLYNPKLKLPIIPCSDGAGIVTEIGSSVTGFQPGDRVCSVMIPDWESGEPGHNILQTTLGGPLDGMLATEVVHPEHAFVKLPDSIPFPAGACLPVAGLTAWNSLVSFGKISQGSKVLLLGTGGVSMMALQIAKTLGAEVVITSGSEEKLEKARGMGADHGINYRLHPEWWRKVLEWSPLGVDLVLEVGGAGTFNQSVRAVRMGGKIALIGVLAESNSPVQLVPVLMKNIQVQGILVGHRQAFREYLQFVEHHQLEPPIDRIFQGFEKVSLAFQTMAKGHHFGKLVINIDEA